MILVIDNYDSFTYNLVQYLGQTGAEVLVKRNDEISVEEMERLRPDGIMLSPGPCTPKESGICLTSCVRLWPPRIARAPFPSLCSACAWDIRQ
jgi:anthranilate/para-aminobenzoate synthase component II